MYNEFPPFARMKAFRPSGENRAVVALLTSKGTLLEVVVVVGDEDEDEDVEVEVVLVTLATYT
jgi:hypothetical protein